MSHGLNETTGMGWVRADLHPDDYQKFKRKLNAEITVLRKRADFDGQRYDQVAAAAFMGLVTSTRAAAQPVSEVAILIDIATVEGGTHAESICEYSDGTPLPVATACRYASPPRMGSTRWVDRLGELASALHPSENHSAVF